MVFLLFFILLFFKHSQTDVYSLFSIQFSSIQLVGQKIFEDRDEEDEEGEEEEEEEEVKEEVKKTEKKM